MGEDKKIMNTVERQFPTEEEADQWIETHTIDNADNDGNPELSTKGGVERSH